MNYPVNKFHRNVIVASSLFFFIPAIRAYYCSTPLLGIMSVMTGCASINFWWFGIPNWRLTLDKIMAYSTTAVYLTTGLFFQIINDDIQGNWMYPILYILIGISAATAYAMSCHKWKRGCATWVMYHVCFHFLLSSGKFLVVGVSCRK